LVIQAFSRTNRIAENDKPFGVIKYYRKPHTMKQHIERAVKMYAGDKAFGMFVDKIGGNVDSKNTEESFIDALKNENLGVYIFPYDINNYEKFGVLKLKNDFEECANLVIKRIEKM